MASSGSFNTSAYSGNSGSRYLTFAWTAQSQSVTDNTTTIFWELKGGGTSTQHFYTRNIKLTINGDTVYSFGGSADNYKKLGLGTVVASGSYTITHKTDGTQTFQAYAEAGVYTYAVNCTGSGTFTLNTIPRATTPTFNLSAVDMGNAVGITMNRANSNFVHDLYYSFAGEAFQYIAGDLGTSYSWTVPDLATKIPNVASGTMTIRCVTRSGSTTIGAKDVLLTVRVPESVMPTISGLTITEATEGLAAQFGAFVKNKSVLTVTVNAAGAKGSTIRSYSTTVQGAVYQDKTFTTGVVTEAGTVSLVTTVTDSRGRSVKLPTNINVLDYYLPETPKLVAYRVDENGVAKTDGKYLCVDYAYKVAPVGNKNTSKMTMSAKRSIDSSWTSILTGSSYNSAAVRKFDKEYTTDYQYDIKLEVEDWFKAKATYTATLPTANVILDIKAAGDGLAFGKTSEFPGFEVAMPAAAQSFHMVGVRSYEIGDAYGHILYNNGMLLQWGQVSVTPTALNTVTQLRTVFPIPYAYRPHITGTLMSNTPTDVDWSMGVGTSETEARTGLVVYVTRGSLYAAPIRWMAMGLVDKTKLPEVTAV